MKHLWMTALLGAALLGACDSKTPTATAPPHIQSAAGDLAGGLIGGREGAVEYFKGVRYAAAPVGDLRWRPPQPAPVDSVPRDAGKYGPDCAQEPFPEDAAPSRNGFSEDCLFLNVWRPTGTTPDAKLPVMVWIHGGGFTTGGTTPAVYDGAHFADKNLVFVSINYRLGRFGFFAFPALTAEHPEEMKGNYGYMDQIAALEWVHRNIAAFGGDPDNVMVFGESAGGGSVHMLLTTPLAKGLFNKAGIESGGGRGSLMGPRRLKEDLPNRPSAETVGINFARANGIAGTDAAALAALRALPADKIIGGLSMMSRPEGPPSYSGPMLDGQLVTGTPQEAYLAGRENAVPLIVGANDADIGFADAKSLDDAVASFGADADKARALYNPDNTPDRHIAIASIAMDKGMTEPARFVAQSFAAHGTPAYEYRFAYVAPEAQKALAESPFAHDMLPGAPHASEIPYVFDTLKDALTTISPADEAMAKAVNAYWANFAKTGNPNGAGLPAWPAYTAENDALMIFTPDGPKGGRDPWGPRLDIVAKHASGK